MAYFSVLKVCCPWWVAGQRSVSISDFFYHHIFIMYGMWPLKSCRKWCSVHQIFCAHCTAWVTASWLILPLPGPQGSLAAVMGVKDIFPIIPHSHGEVLSWRRLRERTEISDPFSLWITLRWLPPKIWLAGKDKLEHAACQICPAVCMPPADPCAVQAGCHLHCR